MKIGTLFHTRICSLFLSSQESETKRELSVINTNNFKITITLHVLLIQDVSFLHYVLAFAPSVLQLCVIYVMFITPFKFALRAITLHHILAPFFPLQHQPPNFVGFRVVFCLLFKAFRYKLTWLRLVLYNLHFPS